MGKTNHPNNNVLQYTIYLQSYLRTVQAFLLEDPSPPRRVLCFASRTLAINAIAVAFVSA